MGKYGVTDGSGNYFDMVYFGDLEAFDKFLVERAGEYMVNRLYSGERVDIPLNVIYYPDIILIHILSPPFTGDILEIPCLYCCFLDCKAFISWNVQKEGNGRWAVR